MREVPHICPSTLLHTRDRGQRAHWNARLRDLHPGSGHLKTEELVSEALPVEESGIINRKYFAHQGQQHQRIQPLHQPRAKRTRYPHTRAHW